MVSAEAGLNVSNQQKSLDRPWIDRSQILSVRQLACLRRQAD